MPLPSRLKEHLSVQLTGHSLDDVVEPLTLPEDTQQGEAEYLTLLRGCLVLINFFEDLSSPEMFKLRMALLKDKQFQEKSGDVIDDLALNIEDLILALIDETAEVSFGEDEIVPRDVKNLDMPEEALYTVGLKVSAKTDQIVQLLFTLPPGMGFEMALDENAAQTYYAVIASMAYVTNLYVENPGRYSFDRNREKWMIADGGELLIKGAIEGANGFLEVIKREYWNGWKKDNNSSQ